MWRPGSVTIQERWDKNVLDIPVKALLESSPSISSPKMGTGPGKGFAGHMETELFVVTPQWIRQLC